MLRRAPQPEPPRRQHLVVCALGAHRFAVPAGRVVEVARLAAYTPLPAADPATLGVVLHRERLIPLVDVAARFGARRSGRPERPGLCLFLKTDRGEIGCLIDEVVGVQPAAGAGRPGGVTLLDPAELGGAYG